MTRPSPAAGLHKVPGPTRAWLSAVSLVGIAGIGASVALAQSPGWFNEGSLSWLGLDPGSALVFNLTLLVMGVLMVGLAASMGRLFSQLRSAGRLGGRAARILSEAFLLMAVAILASGVFRADADPSHTIHNLAGFTSPLLVMAMMAGNRLLFGSLGRRFERLSLAILALIALMFSLAWFPSPKLFSYGAMEVISFVLIGAWLWALDRRLQVILAESGQPAAAGAETEPVGWLDGSPG